MRANPALYKGQMLVFFITFTFLLLLALSYLLASRARLLSLEFAYWLITYQFIFIGALGVGLVQTTLVALCL